MSVLPPLFVIFCFFTIHESLTGKAFQDECYNMFIKIILF